MREETENIRLLGSGTKKRVHGEDDKKSDESTFHPGLWTAAMPLFAMPPSSRRPKKRVREDQVSLLDFNDETNGKMDGAGIVCRYIDVIASTRESFCSYFISFPYISFFFL